MDNGTEVDLVSEVLLVEILEGLNLVLGVREEGEGEDLGVRNFEDGILSSVSMILSMIF